MTRVSRRAFVRLSAAGAVAAPWALDTAARAAGTLTAQDVVDRVRKAVGVDWTDGTGVDDQHRIDPRRRALQAAREAARLVADDHHQLDGAHAAIGPCR